VIYFRFTFVRGGNCDQSSWAPKKPSYKTALAERLQTTSTRASYLVGNKHESHFQLDIIVHILRHFKTSRKKVLL